MTADEREAAFTRARDMMVLAIRSAMRANPEADPLALAFTLVHESSADIYELARALGSAALPGGFVLTVSARRLRVKSLPADRICCVISIDNEHRAVGLARDVIFDDWLN